MTDLISVVPAPRLELGRPYGQGILSPLRLPIPPSGHTSHTKQGMARRQPGAGGAAGEFDISSGLDQESTGTLRIELFGAGSTDHDHLNVGETLDLSGTLELATPTGAYIPTGSSFTIITCFGTVLDVSFDQIIAPANMDVTIDVVSPGSTDDVVVTLTSPCPEDLDLDGTVGFTDVVALLAAWGTPNADIDGSGDTGFNDLVLLLAAWGGCA